MYICNTDDTITYRWFRNTNNCTGSYSDIDYTNIAEYNCKGLNNPDICEKAFVFLCTKPIIVNSCINGKIYQCTNNNTVQLNIYNDSHCNILSHTQYISDKVCSECLDGCSGKILYVDNFFQI